MSMIERHFSCPTVYLSWSFVLTRCCVTAWVMKMLVLAGLTIHTRRIWPESRRFTTPADVLNFPCWEVSNGKTEFSKTGQSHHFCCWFCRRWQSKFELVLVIEIRFVVCLLSHVSPLTGKTIISKRIRKHEVMLHSKKCVRLTSASRSSITSIEDG